MVTHQIMKIFTLGLVVGIASVARAQNFPPTIIKGADYTLEARAYIDPSRLPGSKYNPASRYDLSISTPANAPYRWDFLVPDSNFPEVGISGAFASTDYRTLQKTTLHATLRQFDTYDEKVTFKDLDLVPFGSATLGRLGFPGGPRFLSLPQARSLTTPSGITVTLPAQIGLQPEDMNAVGNGNIDALWMRIQVEPKTRLSQLPDSPLFRKHGRDITIKLEILAPNTLISYAADNTFTGLKIGLSYPKSVTHLDELTLIVRQRVDLQTVPVAIQVPISKPAPQKTKAKR